MYFPTVCSPLGSQSDLSKTRNRMLSLPCTRPSRGPSPLLVGDSELLAWATGLAHRSSPVVHSWSPAPATLVFPQLLPTDLFLLPMIFLTSLVACISSSSHRTRPECSFPREEPSESQSKLGGPMPSILAALLQSVATRLQVHCVLPSLLDCKHHEGRDFAITASTY